MNLTTHNFYLLCNLIFLGYHHHHLNNRGTLLGFYVQSFACVLLIVVRTDDQQCKYLGQHRNILALTLEQCVHSCMLQMDCIDNKSM